MSSSVTANITHVTIYGNCNSGKSSLFNAIINQDIAIVDNTVGTTTDPVHKRIELLPFGPILLTDTAGLNDFSSIGYKRVEKAKKMLSRTNFAILLIDINEYENEFVIENEFKNFEINYVKVFSKIDTVSNDVINLVKSKYPDALFIDNNSINSVLDFKLELIKRLGVSSEKSILGKYLNKGDMVVLVVPVDSEAPKGRLILPQVQLLRDLLDYGINSIVTNEVNLADILNKYEVKMVVTDSQAFHLIANIVPDNIYLTSFSILFANYKSSINKFFTNLDELKEIKNVLICESCTHNVSHEDIGMFKIPSLLRKRFGEDIYIKNVMGNDFVDNVSKFDLIIHCGSCMLSDSVLKYRISIANENNVPITNYGLYLAYESGIIERAIQFFKEVYYDK